jgi:hypothetical protein
MLDAQSAPTTHAPTVRCALMASSVEALACHLEYARDLSSPELKTVASPPPGRSAMDHTRTILSFGLCLMHPLALVRQGSPSTRRVCAPTLDDSQVGRISALKA